ncbi:MAG: tRNA dihydrouridine(20/20a) synthase DusA [Spirochaetales bacterium]|nr:tRNA dihydrouridine(20/20a) synthase DusA [Spirochaetales bacterium]
MIPVQHPVSLAPMIDKSHTYFRQIARTMTRRSLLYTEMVAAAAIIHGNRARLLDFQLQEKPLVLQIGTGSATEAAQAVRIAEDWDYDEINLNVGCPSNKVQSGDFGACLMAEPGRVADIVAAMAEATKKPVSVKHRIGIRSTTKGIIQESYEELAHFLETITPAGAKRFTVHARIALLEGLSPKENREIPPLRYEEVYRLKKDFSSVLVEINGGIRTYDALASHLEHTDGCMIGRVSYDDPYFLAEVDRRFYDSTAPVPTRRQVITQTLDLLKTWQSPGANPRNLLWPILELFSGLPGTRKWKRTLSPPFLAGQELDDLFAQALKVAPAEWLDKPGISKDPLEPTSFGSLTGVSHRGAMNELPKKRDSRGPLG